MVHARNRSYGCCAHNMGKCLCSIYLVKSPKLKKHVGHAYSAKWLEIFKNHLTRSFQLWSQMVYNWFFIPGITGSGNFSGQQTSSNFAENWTHNSTQQGEFKTGVCKPFCQNPSDGFRTYYYLWVSGSNYCWCQQFMNSFFAESLFIFKSNESTILLTSKMAYINNNVNLTPKNSSMF